jgi:hypothetical protein
VAAASGAYQLLRNPQIRARVEALKQARWKRLQMSGDEALYRVAVTARADVLDLFDDHGQLLSPHLWPASVRLAVKSVKQHDGGMTISLFDALTAQRIILEQTGTLKNPLVGGIASLAKLIAGNFTDEDA